MSRTASELSPPWQAAYNIVIGRLRQWEGFNPRAYRDGRLPNGQLRWSIGYGTLASGPGQVISREVAEQRLGEEIRKVIERIHPHFQGREGEFTPQQLAALVSRGYNAGPGRVPAVIRSLLAGNLSQARQQLLTITTSAGVHLPGLVNRRRYELALFDGNENAGPRTVPRTLVATADLPHPRRSGRYADVRPSRRVRDHGYMGLGGARAPSGRGTRQPTHQPWTQQDIQTFWRHQMGM